MNTEISDITSICFKHIKTIDNVEYHKGLYGDFIVIMAKSNDYRNGYINATKLCKDGKKEFFNWKRLEKSKELIEYYEKSPPSDLKGGFIKDYTMFLLHCDNKDSINMSISGTYVSPDLIVDIAIWVSIEFYDKVKKIVNNHIIEEVIELKKDTEKFKTMIKDKECVIKELEISNIELNTSNKELNITNIELNKNITKLSAAIINKTEQINTMRPDTIHKPSDNELLHIVIFHRIKDNTLYCSRLQKKSYNNTIKAIHEKYPTAEEILVLEDVPNAINLFNKIKTDLGELISVTRNSITLVDIDESDFILMVNEIFNDREY